MDDIDSSQESSESQSEPIRGIQSVSLRDVLSVLWRKEIFTGSFIVFWFIFVSWSLTVVAYGVLSFQGLFATSLVTVFPASFVYLSHRQVRHLNGFNIQISDVGISASGGEMSSHFGWESFEGYAVTARTYMLKLPGTNRWLIIVKSNFDGEQNGRILELVQTKCKRFRMSAKVKLLAAVTIIPSLIFAGLVIRNEFSDTQQAKFVRKYLDAVIAEDPLKAEKMVCDLDGIGLESIDPNRTLTSSWFTGIAKGQDVSDYRLKYTSNDDGLYWIEGTLSAAGETIKFSTGVLDGDGKMCIYDVIAGYVSE